MFTKYIFLLSAVLILQSKCEDFEECKNLEIGTFVASSKNCHQYIYCNGIESVIGDCPQEHHFNADEHICDVNENFICPITEEESASQQLINDSTTTNKVEITNTFASSSSEAVTTTLSTLTMTTSNVISEELTELLKPSNAVERPKCQPDVEETFAHPLKCEYYYKCISGFLTILRCNFNYAWDFQLKRCMPMNEVKCLSGEL